MHGVSCIRLSASLVLLVSADVAAPLPDRVPNDSNWHAAQNNQRPKYKMRSTAVVTATAWAAAWHQASARRHMHPGNLVRNPGLTSKHASGVRTCCSLVRICMQSQTCDRPSSPRCRLPARLRRRTASRLCGWRQPAASPSWCACAHACVPFHATLPAGNRPWSGPRERSAMQAGTLCCCMQLHIQVTWPTLCCRAAPGGRARQRCSWRRWRGWGCSRTRWPPRLSWTPAPATARWTWRCPCSMSCLVSPVPLGAVGVGI